MFNMENAGICAYVLNQVLSISESNEGKVLNQLKYKQLLGNVCLLSHDSTLSRVGHSDVGFLNMIKKSMFS